MAETATVAALQAALKIKWPGNKLVQTFYEESPFAKSLPLEAFEGQDDMRLPIQYAAPQGRSASLATAIANMSASEQKAFSITTAKDYGAFKISGEAIIAGLDGYALVKLLDNQLEGAMRTVRDAFGNDVFGDGSGQIGVVDTEPAAGQIKLTNLSDISNWELNKKFVASTDGAALIAGTGTVTAVNRDTGIITYSAAGGFDPAPADKLYTEGDFLVKIKGLGAWNPVTAPDSTLFFNVNRAVDVVRLSGWRHAANGSTAFDAVEQALTRASRHGSKPDRMVCGSDFASSIRRNLGDRMRLTTMKSPSTNIEMEVESFSVAGRRVVLVEDFKCPGGLVRFWKHGSVKIYARKKQIPMILNLDGKDIERHPTEDAYIGRLGYYAQMGCPEPIHLGVMTGV